eukprot:Skav216457  [mRNA]  locus=scaffold50:752320:752655:- [translate_table: standard]
MLLERYVPVNHADELSQTALFNAALQVHAGTIKYLIRKGANPNLLDENWETAIFDAVSKKQMDAAKALLDGGGDLEVVNSWQHLHECCTLPTLAKWKRCINGPMNGPSKSV